MKGIKRITIRLLIGTFMAAILFAPCVTHAREIFVFGGASASPLELPFGLVQSVQSAEEAVAAFEQILRDLPDEQKNNPIIIDSLTRLAEVLVRQSASVDISANQPLTIGLVRQQASEARLTMLTLELLAERYGFRFLREIRAGVTFNYQGNAAVAFDGGLNAVGAHQITLATPFASLTVDIPNTTEPVELSLGRYPEIIPTDPLQLVMSYWGIGASSLVVLIWLAAILISKKRVPWWIPAILCVTALAVNLAMEGLPQQGIDAATPDDSLIMVSMGGVDSAVLSIPTTAPRPNEYVLFDNDRQPIANKYNNVMHTIDARIYEGGVFQINISPVHFTDLDGKSSEMMQAIYMLTSRGLMATPDDNKFVPDRLITRAEFLSVVLNFLHLVDSAAVSPFIDVLPNDWFYAVAASSHAEGLVEGFADGTFRGNEPMPKDQMVVVAANVLVRVMRYSDLTDDYILGEHFADAEQIGEWSRERIALATATGIIPDRPGRLFASSESMTRGDAAIMLYRIFMRLW